MELEEIREVAKSFLRERFREAEIIISRVYRVEGGTEVAGEIKLASGQVRRFTVIIDESKGRVRGYGLR